MSNTKMRFEDSIEYDIMTTDFGEKLMEKYQLFNKIHESSVSQIFIVKNHETNESFTLKAINKNSEYAWDLDAISKVKNAKIAQVIDVQTTEKYIYILKEYIHGVTLEEYVLKNHPLAEKTVIEIGVEICEILDYFHLLKPSPVVYRDLKPANLIMADTGEIKLIDTDSVRQYKNTSKKDTFYVGTDGFASPEQFGFSQTDNRTDIYALGTTLFFLLTGMKPESDKFKLKNIKSVRSDVSDAMSRIIEKCTEFHPEARYQQVTLLKSDLLDLLKQDILSKSMRFVKRTINPKMLLMIAILFALLMTTAFAFSYFKGLLNPGTQVQETAHSNLAGNSSSAIPEKNSTESASQTQTLTTPIPDQAQTVMSTTSPETGQDSSIEGEIQTDSPTPDTAQSPIPVSATSSTDSSTPDAVQSSLPTTTPSPSQIQDSFYQKTTILEAFWSGNLPTKLPVAFTDYYKNVSKVKYDPITFVISIQEWKMGVGYIQMGERVNQVGGAILLKAKGYSDVICQITTGSVTANDGTAQLYFVRLNNETDLVTGVKYSIVDPNGHWISNPGVFVERLSEEDIAAKVTTAAAAPTTVESSSSTETTASPDSTEIPNENNDSIYDKTTILETFWSGEVPHKLPVSFIEFIRQNVSARRKSDVFFVSIKEWFVGADDQMVSRIKTVGGDLILRAEGYPDLVMYMDGGSMTYDDGGAMVYFAYVENEWDMESGVNYQIIDTTGHWIVDNGVFVTRPVK